MILRAAKTSKCAGSRLASHRYSCQPFLTLCFWAAWARSFVSVITRINFVGWPFIRLFVLENLVTFIALLFKSSSFTSSYHGLVFGLGSVFLAFILAFGKGWVRFSECIRHSLEARSSCWKKKLVFFHFSHLHHLDALKIRLNCSCKLNLWRSYFIDWGWLFFSESFSFIPHFSKIAFHLALILPLSFWPQIKVCHFLFWIMLRISLNEALKFQMFSQEARSGKLFSIKNFFS